MAITKRGPYARKDGRYQIRDTTSFLEVAVDETRNHVEDWWPAPLFDWELDTPYRWLNAYYTRWLELAIFNAERSRQRLQINIPADDDDPQLPYRHALVGGLTLKMRDLDEPDLWEIRYSKMFIEQPGKIPGSLLMEKVLDMMED